MNISVRRQSTTWKEGKKQLDMVFLRILLEHAQRTHTQPTETMGGKWRNFRYCWAESHLFLFCLPTFLYLSVWYTESRIRRPPILNHIDRMSAQKITFNFNSYRFSHAVAGTYETWANKNHMEHEIRAPIGDRAFRVCQVSYAMASKPNDWLQR